jgi:membrane associated rhomboid family serine protease
MPKIRSAADDIPTQGEALLQLSAEIGIEGMMLFGGVLVLYLVTGVLVTTALGVEYPYSFLSLKSDPVFLLDGAVVGIFTVQGAVSLLLHHASVGIDSESVPSVVLSFIGLGLGGAILQLTLPKALQIVFGIV